MSVEGDPTPEFEAQNLDLESSLDSIFTCILAGYRKGIPKDLLVVEEIKYLPFQGAEELEIEDDRDDYAVGILRPALGCQTLDTTFCSDDGAQQLLFKITHLNTMGQPLTMEVNEAEIVQVAKIQYDVSTEGIYVYGIDEDSETVASYYVARIDEEYESFAAHLIQICHYQEITSGFTIDTIQTERGE